MSSLPIFDVAAFLRELGPFSTLTRAALSGIVKLVELKDFRAGERIIARGEPGDAMYIIRSGEVRIPILDGRGVETMVAKLSKGQIFGEMSLMTGDPRTADVYAVDGVGTLVIRKEAFDQITRVTPSLARFLTQILADRLAQGGLMASKTIGKYQLVGELGRGGMSIVYNAVHTSLNRPVAVKMLNHQLAFDEHFRAQFQQEARLIAALNHENIIQVYDTEQAYATYFIMMEFVKGTSLSKLVEGSGKLPDEQVRDILVQMCRALGYAHEHGIVHRDVKPSNVIMTPDGRVKLMDFGIATTRKAQQVDGEAAGEGSAGGRPGGEPEEIVGTAEYMAPEQIDGSGTGRRSDIYALGIMAYQMLTGELPFVAENPYDVLLAHLTRPFPDVRAKAAGAPDDLVAFVERATRRNPAERFKNMAEAEHLLAGSMHGAFGPREGKVVTIFYAPSEAGNVERAIASLRQSLAGNPNVRLGTHTLSAP